eukprot:gnl/TRDRNA2_/TRDRNA2_137842_c0_seq1.p1 gnl/TRDRNA2_/TRDRNA2_137842_c0~~gnl/TRDRNA2_/TRDRNA2_137842_c0_seq1.p1  ORF type:complete len:101 (-),score=0.70 gnl/TRDRNA2_/TRDRNA2_137842_c0_seq1:92-394(-)
MALGCFAGCKIVAKYPWVSSRLILSYHSSNLSVLTNQASVFPTTNLQRPRNIPDTKLAYAIQPWNPSFLPQVALGATEYPHQVCPLLQVLHVLEEVQLRG